MNSDNHRDSQAKPLPSPAMTTEEIEAALGHEPLDYCQGFYAGVRWAEQQHRITE